MSNDCQHQQTENPKGEKPKGAEEEDQVVNVKAEAEVVDKVILNNKRKGAVKSDKRSASPQVVQSPKRSKSSKPKVGKENIPKNTLNTAATEKKPRSNPTELEHPKKRGAKFAHLLEHTPGNTPIAKRLRSRTAKIPILCSSKLNVYKIRSPTGMCCKFSCGVCTCIMISALAGSWLQN